MHNQVVVTGAAGYLGRHLTRHLIERETEVVAVLAPGESKGSLTKYPATNLRCVEADITVPATLDGIFTDAEVVYHLAGLVSATGDVARMRSVNVDGVANVIDAATAAGALTVHVASISALGPTPNSPVGFDETHTYRPSKHLSAYEQTKRDGYLVAANPPTRARVRIAFPAGIYGGGGDTHGLSCSRFMEMYASHRIPVVAPADLVQSFVHVDDVADGLIRIAEAGRDGEGYVLSASVLTLGELLTKVAHRSERAAPVEIPRRWLRPLTPLIHGVSLLSADPDSIRNAWHLVTNTPYAYRGDKARSELGWSPRSIDDGITDFINDLTYERYERAIREAAVRRGELSAA